MADDGLMDDELRLRVRMIGAGIRLSAVLLSAVGIWVACTWGDPNRAGMAAIDGAAAVVTAGVALLPRPRIVASRWREAFFLAWSLSLIAFISTFADLDAGVRSPIVLMLFLTLVYAALSYPRWAIAVVTGVSLLAVAVLSWDHSASGAGPTDPVYLAGLMLTLAVTGVMCTVQARIQAQTRRELRRVSRIDPLTGALNRRGFTERLNAELARGTQAGRPVALVVLDLDYFKEVNDRDGHAAGDALLCWAVAAMTAALRPGDALGRLGGDEFAAVLVGVGAEEAGQVADRMRLALSARVGASRGVAATDRDGVVAEVLHRRSDQRLYAAKRDRVGPESAAGPIAFAQIAVETPSADGPVAN